MSTLQSNYRAVIEHIAADIETLRKGGLIADTSTPALLGERHEWLILRRERLYAQRNQIILGFRKRLDDYLSNCERFWQSRHDRTYEKKLCLLHETKQRVVKIYALSGFDACHALLLTLKHLREILPLPQYDEHAPALEALEAIKRDCYEQLATYNCNIQ